MDGFPIFVLLTSLWVLIDAKNIGMRKGQTSGFFDLGPWSWFFACIFIWIIAFPMYLIKRSEYKKNAEASGGFYKETSGNKDSYIIPIIAIGLFSIKVFYLDPNHIIDFSEYKSYFIKKENSFDTSESKVLKSEIITTPDSPRNNVENKSSEKVEVRNASSDIAEASKERIRTEAELKEFHDDINKILIPINENSTIIENCSNFLRDNPNANLSLDGINVAKKILSQNYLIVEKRHECMGLVYESENYLPDGEDPEADIQHEMLSSLYYADPSATKQRRKSVEKNCNNFLASSTNALAHMNFNIEINPDTCVQKLD